MHKQSVQTDLRRRPENRGSMALEYAVDSPTLDAATRAVVRTILATWERKKPALDSPEVQDWIHQVLSYFRGCFCRGDGSKPEDWHADVVRIDSAADPLDNAECHAGVHLIRKYYPEFQPTREHFARAYWGKNPK
jgi:hypothetical protein